MKRLFEKQFDSNQNLAVASTILAAFFGSNQTIPNAPQKNAIVSQYETHI